MTVKPELHMRQQMLKPGLITSNYHRKFLNLSDSRGCNGNHSSRRSLDRHPGQKYLE
jgi:hypothetical protein